MVFKFKGTALNRLDDAFFHRRNYHALRALLYQIGLYCFERRSDGVFSIKILRSFPLASHFRTRSHAHLPALVDCGAIEACGHGMYRYVGFDEHNLSSEQMQERDAQSRAYWSEAKRASRKFQSKALEYAQAMKTQQQKNALLGTNIDFLEKCPAQPTETTPPCTDLSVTNFIYDATELPEVDSPKVKPKQSELMHNIEPELAALIHRAQQRSEEYALHHQAPMAKEVPKLLEQEIAAVERELAGESITTTPTPTLLRSVHNPKYATRLARKPKTRTSLTEPVVEKALRELQVCLSAQDKNAWFAEMRANKASAEDLQYAVWTVVHQANKRKIHHPLAYAKRVLAAQAHAMRQGAF